MVPVGTEVIVRCSLLRLPGSGIIVRFGVKDLLKSVRIFFPMKFEELLSGVEFVVRPERSRRSAGWSMTRGVFGRAMFLSR